MNARVPPIEPLHEICKLLKKGNIIFALGGSGLMVARGLETPVRDWDITTDASWNTVEPLIKHLDYQLIGPNGIFATKYLCKISHLGAEIDLMGGFALRTSNGIYEVPTFIEGDWKGTPLGSLSVWAKVYEIMGRQAKANRLREFLATKSVES